MESVARAESRGCVVRFASGGWHNRLRVKGQFIKWLLTLTRSLKRYYVIHLAVANVRRIYDCHRGEEAPVGRGNDEICLSFVHWKRSAKQFLCAQRTENNEGHGICKYRMRKASMELECVYYWTDGMP